MFIELQGKKIHYLRQGKGETILFVHGWGGSVNSLKSLFEAASKNFDSLIIDLPGFGKSDPPNTDWSVQEYSDILVELINKLNLGKITYFGHSFGGSLGIVIAVQNPHLISKLVLCNSAYRRSNKRNVQLIILKQIAARIIPLSDKHKASIRSFLYKIFLRNSDLTKFPELESNYRKIITQDLTPLITQIKVPTSIIWGETDTYTPVELAYELHEKISGSTLKVFPHIGHNLPIKYPELVYKEISI